MTKGERIAMLYAALGKRFDPMRKRWDEMGRGDRNLLALSARLPGAVVGKEWDQLRAETQNAITAAYGRMVEHVKGWEGVAA